MDISYGRQLLQDILSSPHDQARRVVPAGDVRGGWVARLLHYLGFLPEGRTALVLTDDGREGRGEGGGGRGRGRESREEGGGGRRRGREGREEGGQGGGRREGWPLVAAGAQSLFDFTLHLRIFNKLFSIM